MQGRRTSRFSSVGTFDITTYIIHTYMQMGFVRGFARANCTIKYRSPIVQLAFGKLCRDFAIASSRPKREWKCNNGSRFVSRCGVHSQYLLTPMHSLSSLLLSIYPYISTDKHCNVLYVRIRVCLWGVNRVISVNLIF